MKINLDKKKDPSDYPLLSFRINEEEKEIVMQRLEEILTLVNDNKDNNQKKARKNKIIVTALKRGLDEIEKDYKKARKKR